MVGRGGARLVGVVVAVAAVVVVVIVVVQCVGKRGPISDQESAVSFANLGLQDSWKFLKSEARL